MNLHGLVRGAITAVNPDIQATVTRADGYTTGPSGKQVPVVVSSPALVQVQGLNAKDIEHMNALNIQGVLRSVHLYGDWRGIQRATSSGGDTMTFNGQSWRVVHVMETWPDWSRVIVAQQVS